MSLAEAFVSATRQIRELELNSNINASQTKRRIEMKDSITPSRIAWIVYQDTKDDKLYVLENFSKKDIEEAKAKLAVRQSDFKNHSDMFPINFPSHSPEGDSTWLKPISSISLPTLHWFEKAQPVTVSLLAQCSRPIVSEGLCTPHMLSKNVRWSVRTLLFVPGSIECLEREIVELIMIRNGLPIPLEDLPDLYYWKYGYRFLPIDGYKNQDDEPRAPLCSLNEALGSKMKGIQLHNRTILIKDRAIVNPESIYITCPTDAKYKDIKAHFRELDENSIVVHFQQGGCGFVTCSSPASVDDILSRTNPHKVGDYDVRVHHSLRHFAQTDFGYGTRSSPDSADNILSRTNPHRKVGVSEDGVHHYLKQFYPSTFSVPGFNYQQTYTLPYASRATGVGPPELQGLQSTKFHFVMGCEEACYIQLLEDEDHHRRLNPPTRDDHRYSVPELPNLPDDPFNMGFGDNCTSHQ